MLLLRSHLDTGSTGATGPGYVATWRAQQADRRACGSTRSHHRGMTPALRDRPSATTSLAPSPRCASERPAEVSVRPRADGIAAYGDAATHSRWAGPRAVGAVRLSRTGFSSTGRLHQLRYFEELRRLVLAVAGRPPQRHLFVRCFDLAAK